EFAACVGAAAEATGARVLGAHIEGPFLNPSFRGAHLRSHLADPTPENVDVILAARPRLVTIAPELPGALAAVERLHGAGVVVAAGHTGADFEQGRQAIVAGAAAAMLALVRLIARLPGLTVVRAISLASAVPARVLGESRLGRISEGSCADLVILDADLHVRLTMIRGVVKFRRPS